MDSIYHREDQTHLIAGAVGFGPRVSVSDTGDSVYVSIQAHTSRSEASDVTVISSASVFLTPEQARKMANALSRVADYLVQKGVDPIEAA
jgi:hypothetical protein